MANNLILKLLIEGSAALTGDFAGAKAIWQELGRDIDAVLRKPLLTEPAAIQSAANIAAKRGDLERQLANEVERLEKFKAYQAGTTSENVAAKAKAAVDAQIADQRRLVDAVRSAWQESLKEAEKYAEAAQQKLTKATDIRASGKAAAFNAGISGMSEQDQIAAKQQRMADLQGQGNYEAARARVAALEGDIKKYDTAAAAAEARLKEALSLAQDVKDVAAIETISGELAKIQEAGASLDKKKSEEAKTKAADQAKLLNELQAKLEELTKDARTVEIKAEITDAETKIKGFKAQLDELAKGVSVPIKVTQDGQATTNPVTPEIGRAFGGPLPGYAPHDRADNVAYWGTPGEWVIQRPAVRYWGPEFIAAINAMRMPKFAMGGQIGNSSAISRISFPRLSTVEKDKSPQLSPTVFNFPQLGKFEVQASADVQKEIERVFSRASLRYGR